MMTITTQSNRVVHSANGATTQWNYNFLINEAVDVQIFTISSTGVKVLLNASTYSITGLGNPVGGLVTYPLIGSPLATGYLLVIERILTITQPTQVSNQLGFYPQSIEDALDRVVMIEQQLKSSFGDAFTVLPGQTPPVININDFLGVGGAVGIDGTGNFIRIPTGAIGSTIITSQITDSGPTGREIIKAADAAALQSILTYATAADLAAATIGATGNYVVIRERTTGNGGGGVLRRVGAVNPGHAWAIASNAGALWWEFVPPAVTPEQGAFTDLAAASSAIDAVSYYGNLELDSRARVTNTYPVPWSTKITGPGCDLITYLGMGVRVGDDLTQSEIDNFPVRQIHKARRGVNLSRVGQVKASLTRTAALSITTSGTAQAITGDNWKDQCGAIDPATLSFFKIGFGWRRVRLTGFLNFAANATGARQAILYKLSSPVTAITIPAAAGVETSVPFTFEVDVTSGDTVQVLAVQTSGGALNLTKAEMHFEVVEYDMIAPPGERGLIFQSSWTALETAMGGFNNLANTLAGTKDIFILSGISTFNSDNGLGKQTPKKIWYNTKGAWAFSIPVVAGERWHSQAENLSFTCNVGHTTPASGTFAAYRAANPTHWTQVTVNIQNQAVGYSKMRRLIRYIKRVNPAAEVWGYASAARDAPYWDAGGNPQTQLTAVAAGNNANVAFEILEWRDGGLEIDGIFLDHCASSFIDSAQLDNVVSICNLLGLPVALNITFPSVANVQFVTKSTQVRPGSMIVLEGFYRDNGDDVNVFSQQVLTELNDHHRGRHLRFFAINEEAAATPVVPGSLNDINGKSLFDSFKRPGDVYQYGRNSYDTIT
jgi:hypothetical protein